MTSETFQSLLTNNGTPCVTRRTAFRSVVGGAIVLWTATRVTPRQDTAAHASRKAGKRQKTQKRKEQGTPSTAVPPEAPAPVPTPEEASREPIVIEDPCEAFPDRSCG